jgi:Bacterial regulatory helix-turn-helix protein, lysR family
MLDRVSLDQLRTFIAVVDEKSFSAAGRRLRRAQSVVSQPLGPSWRFCAQASGTAPCLCT